MKREVGTLVPLVALATTLLGAIPALASTSISSCPFTITAPGAYVLAQDLTCAGTAITITASNVDLNLNGHNLSGSGAGEGVFVQGQANVSIEHGTVQGFQDGIHLDGSLNCKLTNLTLGQCSFGISSEGGAGTTMTGNTANGNGFAGILLDTNSRGNTVTHSTANQNGSAGILIENGAFANTVTDNTANGNGFAGINLVVTTANTVTDNTTIGNGDRGIDLLSANGDTVTRNTSDRNGASGIDVDAGSSGNTVARNSATANGDGGIRLLDGPTQNTIQDNTVSGSFRGIWLALGAEAHNNTIQGNTSTLNVFGIVVEQGSTNNSIQGNTFLNSGNVDAEDDNPGCDSNHWLNNRFVTFLVAGGPDAGCLLGQPNGALVSVTGGNPATLSPGDCLTLNLKVRFAGRGDYLDVTAWSEASFSTDKGHGVLTGNQLCVGPADAGTSFTVYGRYRDPVSGVTATGTVSVHVLK